MPSEIILALLLLVFWGSRSAEADELRVPAFTAYLLPNPNSARVTEQHGITKWSDSSQTVNWYGKFSTAGDLTAKVTMRITLNVQSRCKLTVDGESRELSVDGLGNDSPVVADFGNFTIRSIGYQRIVLESLNEPPRPIGDIDALLLGGSSIVDAHFNLKERRNAASVHLTYPVPKETKIDAFYCEATAIEDPTATFYMACGWHRGYFGMQVNSETERRIIFSVWDSGNEATDRGKVADENRVKLIGKGKDVFTGDFGNEGTGGHSHLKYPWKTGDKQRFLVTAKSIDGSLTDFSGYWFHPDQQAWMLISSWRAPRETGLLKGLHSFSENFGGSNGHLVRKALYGNQWIRTTNGDWIEWITASFSHDPTGKSDRLDRFMGIEHGQFFLSHGGFIDGYTQFGENFTRPSTDHAPPSIP